ncbi:Acyl-CoA dehydrogenase [Candidatus Rhodobacter oscarellae]|uniref:Acyl-CoA dehydrogenase n=1 Tax=Candidatus Rhodobacter oscarellae TaxID=1675527 RepID=A0A0J9E2Y9_9RHOB|nr:acyl-CoA dehydrogenase family protein [Candidatus Rhodobacter lobularis]KMW57072.1 Acyl-CoA dehydrogenase [Candidatus Rhodobacter lobularis]
MTDPTSELPTHTVENQPGPRVAELWRDAALQDGLAAHRGDIAAARGLAQALSQPQMQEAGRQANRHAPQLRLFDAAGRRLDEVEFHPSYHWLLGLGLEHGYAACAWEDGARGGHVTHAAMVYLMNQVEPGVCCPMTMTYAAVPAMSADAALAQSWVPKLTARHYDPSVVPLSGKTAATLGMAMTEKQGGSDVRANTTRAEPDGDDYRLFGHKWFCSAPMSDGFLTLAQAPGGLTCFLVPRWLEDGSRNAIHLMRLKDKLGNRANASAEIEYHGAFAHRLGEEGQGVRTIIEMVHHTRLDTAVAPAGLMRAALGEALHWCAGRSAFQRRLIDQPLMRAVLADLALDVEGALALGLRVAAAYDDPDQRPFARIAVALAKFLNNKRAPGVIYECMEALGGMGFVEDTPMPQLYREAPLNSIWEGSGNVICLDVLRTLAREPEASEALIHELRSVLGADARYDQALAEHARLWSSPAGEAEARLFTERTATLLTAAALIKTAPSAVAEGYVASRVIGDRGHVAGTVSGLDVDAILARVMPSGSG